MSKCYLCGTELIDTNVSEEHIILNALGGRYKSKKLLCKKCNNSTGCEYDAVLANQYHFLTNMLGLDLERGKTPPVNMNADDGHTYTIKSGMTPELSHPIVINEKLDEKTIALSITARSKKELEDILSKYKKKGYDINIEESLEKAVYSKEPAPQMHSKLTFGGIESFPAILKMAVSQYIDKTDDIENVKSAIEDINHPGKDFSTFNKVELCVLEKNIFEEDDNEVLHSILLCASKEKHKLYAIIQLFSTQQYIVKLSNTYNGSDFTDLMIYDVLKKDFKNKTIHWTPDFDYIFNYEYPKAHVNYEIMQGRFARVMKIAQENQNERLKNKIIEEVTEKVMKKVEELVNQVDYPTQEEINQMCNELLDELLPKD